MEAIERWKIFNKNILLVMRGKILDDIAENNLYLRHLGKSFRDSSWIIDAASFVLRTAAFE